MLYLSRLAGRNNSHICQYLRIFQNPSWLCICSQLWSETKMCYWESYSDESSSTLKQTQKEMRRLTFIAVQVVPTICCLYLNTPLNFMTVVKCNEPTLINLTTSITEHHKVDLGKSRFTRTSGKITSPQIIIQNCI